MTRRVEFTVYGTPAPQGSKRHVGNGRMVESSKHLAPWREAVKHAALSAPVVCGADDTAAPFPRGQALAVRVTFYLPRPRGHYGTGRNTDTLRPTAPPWPTSKPDVDKLLRAIGDALTDSGLIHDDSQIVALTGVKAYTEHHPRARITIREHTD